MTPRASGSRPPEGPAVPLVDLKAQHASIEGEVLAAAQRVIAAQAFILGEPVKRFETAFAAACEVPHAAGVGSGSDALLLALRACGVAPGDAVVTTAFTFVATAEAIVRAGARPVFADIDPETMTLAPASVEAALEREERARAVLPVHLFGCSADMDAITRLARGSGRRVVVIEDAAQAIGARSPEGALVGTLGDAAAYSFFPSKNLGGWGDGGAVTSHDVEVDGRVRRLRQHGLATSAGGEEEYLEVGLNSRLDALQAAVLEVKLRHLAGWTRARREVAARYDAAFRHLEEGERLTLPQGGGGRGGGHHVYNQYVVRTDRRDALADFLGARAVGSRRYYARPLHRQPCFGAYPYRGVPLPETERAAATSLALPIYAELEQALQGRVIDAVLGFFTR